MTLRAHAWSAKAPAHNTAFGRGVPVALDPGLDGTEAKRCQIMLRSNFAEGTRYLEEQFAGRRRRIEVGLVKVEKFQVLDCSREITEGIVPR